MVIGLTGHTSGIGKVLFEALSKKYRIKGFSLSNGFNIANADDRQKVIEAVVDDCDIFINNAYSVDDRQAQLLLFRQIYGSWKSLPKLIIVNSSLMPTYQKWNTFDPNLEQYGRSKKELIDECDRVLFDQGAKCRVVNIKLGFVETQMTEKFLIEKMKPQSVVPYFEQAIIDPLVREITAKL